MRRLNFSQINLYLKMGGVRKKVVKIDCKKKMTANAISFALAS